MQAIEWDGEVIRFRKNAFVRYMVDIIGLNDLVALSSDSFPREDYEQLMQLIGYSVSAFGSLSETSEETRDLADAAAEKLR